MPLVLTPIVYVTNIFIPVIVLVCIMEHAEKCDICSGTNAVIKICLTCSGKVDYNKLVVYAAVLNSRAGLTLSQISLRTGLHRNTVSSHSKKLEVEGLIFVKYYGNTKFCQVPGKHLQSEN